MVVDAQSWWHGKKALVPPRWIVRHQVGGGSGSRGLVPSHREECAGVRSHAADRARLRNASSPLLRPRDAVEGGAQHPWLPLLLFSAHRLGVIALPV